MTMGDLAKLSDSEKRIRIAELCPSVRKEESFLDETVMLYDWQRNGKWIRFDPLNDLNACHEMEKVLTRDQRVYYTHCILDSSDEPTDYQACTFATARQRCDAFLLSVG